MVELDNNRSILQREVDFNSYEFNNNNNNNNDYRRRLHEQTYAYGDLLSTVLAPWQ